MQRYGFKLPDIGEGIAEAEIVAWHVKVGDQIEEDAPLVDMMTDKATVELSSPKAGRVVSLMGKAGDKVRIGSEIAVLDLDGEAGEADAVSAAQPAPPAPARPPPAPASAALAGAPPAAAPPAHAPPASAPPTPSADAAPAPAAPPSPDAVAPPRAVPGPRPLASPAVRRRARELGIGLAYVQGSGPAGRIEHADLDRYAQSRSQTPGRAPLPPAAAAPEDAVEEIPIIGLRRRIAERMALSKRSIPHYSYVEETDVTALEALRGQLNDEKPAGGRPRLTVLPFIIRALIRAIRRHPAVNSRYDEEAGVLHRHQAVHLGMATQTPQGLLVPVLRHAEQMDLWQLAAEITRLAEAARSGRAARQELSGSTITLTSLGPLGGIVHTPVINHPEVAIVGVNRMVQRPVVVGDRIEVRTMMNISSSFDHRMVDGWDAARFIQDVKAAIEQPALLFLP